MAREFELKPGLSVTVLDLQNIIAHLQRNRKAVRRMKSDAEVPEAIFDQYLIWATALADPTERAYYSAGLVYDLRETIGEIIEAQLRDTRAARDRALWNLPLRTNGDDGGA